MTVIDTSVVVDYLLGAEAAPAMQRLMADELDLAAPDVLAFEVLAVLRRECARGDLPAERAERALERLTALPLELFPSLPSLSRAWSLRHNLTAADALFVVLAEALDEPLATKDAGLAAAAAKTGVTVVALSG